MDQKELEGPLVSPAATRLVMRGQTDVCVC